MTSKSNPSMTLIVGGSGMLADASIWLAEQSPPVVVLGRSEQKLEALVKRAPATTMIPLAVDYRSLETLRLRLRSLCKTHGPITRTIAWVHSNGEAAHDVIAEAMQGDGDYYHILGSAAADPREDAFERYAALRERFGERYHEIVLGFQLEGERSRWLTHEEISSGVIEALERQAPRSVVGVVEPWERRP